MDVEVDVEVDVDVLVECSIKKQPPSTFIYPSPPSEPPPGQ